MAVAHKNPKIERETKCVFVVHVRTLQAQARGTHRKHEIDSVTQCSPRIRRSVTVCMHSNMKHNARCWYIVRVNGSRESNRKLMLIHDFRPLEEKSTIKAVVDRCSAMSRACLGASNELYMPGCDRSHQTNGISPTRPFIRLSLTATKSATISQRPSRSTRRSAPTHAKPRRSTTSW